MKTQNSAQIVATKWNNMEQKIESEQGKCKTCGSNLYFCPATQDLACEKCGNHYEIKNDGIIETHDLHENRADKKAEHDEYVSKNKAFKCPNCGANVILNQYEISNNCPYCGTSLVVQQDLKVGMKPDACIPFAFDEKGAAEKFVAGVKRKFWAPRKFKEEVPENQIHGIYIPSFAYDMDTASSYSGRLYNEHTTTDSDGHSHTERTYFYISGSHSSRFEDEVVESSSKISQGEMLGVLPYRHNQQKPYKNEYILGYSVEQYDHTVEECFPICKSIVDGKIRSQILGKYHYDGVDYLNVSSAYFNEQYRYCILPIYRFDYSYKKKKYITYMNGQTGKVDNNVPKSKLKITFAVLIPILIILAIIILPIILGSGN